MKGLKKVFLALVICLSSVAAFAGCDFGGGDDGGSGSHGKPVATYTFATVNYHYQYNVLIEEYYQEKYSILKDETYEITKFYTPPEKSGYTFAGYTREAGGEGELVSLPFSIKGSGGGGTVYNLYAKYVPITYEVVYYLDGGTNHADNPTTASGKVTLKNPSKDGYFFWGWYEDEDFTTPIETLTLRSGEDTTIHCYAKWGRINTISYSVNASGSNIKLTDQSRPESYISYGTKETSLFLTHTHYAGYLFAGWTYEGQTEPVRGNNATTINIPVTTEGDLHFVANYLHETDFNALGITLEDSEDGVTTMT
ncbi:MAG: InlB B-repeat-containing protein, partial [Clostridiales bacterium]|nr:InlB B-repeat-containing protein [Clostridiales bacterium]